jgi:hypothetical protein
VFLAVAVVGQSSLIGAKQKRNVRMEKVCRIHEHDQTIEPAGSSSLGDVLPCST